METYITCFKCFFAAALVACLIPLGRCQLIHHVSAPFGQQICRSNSQLGQNCSLVFSPENRDDDYILIIKVNELVGRTEDDYIVWPDGERWTIANNSRPSNNSCRKYARANENSNNCVRKLSEEYCSGDPFLVDSWPPTITSHALGTPGSIDLHLYFEIVYVYVFCSDSQSKFPDCRIKGRSSGPTAAAILFAILFFICMIVIIVLLCKQRNPSGCRKSATKSSDQANVAYYEVDPQQNNAVDATYSTIGPPGGSTILPKESNMADPVKMIDESSQNGKVGPSQTSANMEASGPETRKSNEYV